LALAAEEPLYPFAPAVLLLRSHLVWERYDEALRAAPIGLLVRMLGICAIEGKGGRGQTGRAGPRRSPISLKPDMGTSMP